MIGNSLLDKKIELIEASNYYILVIVVIRN